MMAIKNFNASKEKKSSSDSKKNKKTYPNQIKEVGGRKGPEPTRYGDWEKNGRCTDF